MGKQIDIGLNSRNKCNSWGKKVARTYKRIWMENLMKQSCKLRKNNLGVEWLASQSEGDAILRGR